MNEENVTKITSRLKGNVSDNHYGELKDLISAADDSKAGAAEAVKVKSRNITTLLSAVLGLFGAGSFYLGQIKRGICKVVFNIIVPVVLLCVFLVYLGPANLRYFEQSGSLLTTANERDSLTRTTATSYSDAYNALNSNLTVIDTNVNNIAIAYNDISGEYKPFSDFAVSLNDFEDTYIAGLTENEQVVVALLDDVLEYANASMSQLSQYVTENISDEIQSQDYLATISSYSAIIADSDTLIASLAQDADPSYSSVHAEIIFLLGNLGRVLPEQSEYLDGVTQNVYFVYDLTRLYGWINRLEFTAIDGQAQNVKGYLDNMLNTVSIFDEASKGYEKTYDGITGMSEMIKDAVFSADLAQILDFLTELLSNVNDASSASADSAELLSAMSALVGGGESDALSGNALAMEDGLKDIISNHSASISSAEEWATDYNHNLNGYSDDADPENDITGLLNEQYESDLSEDVYFAGADLLSALSDYSKNISSYRSLIADRLNGTDSITSLTECLQNISVCQARFEDVYDNLTALYNMIEETHGVEGVFTLEDQPFNDIDPLGHLASIIASVKEAEENANYDDVQTSATTATSQSAAFVSTITDHHWTYYFIENFCFMFFGAVVGCDLLIVLIYWVFEVFRDREKCSDFNYNNIVKSLN